jgi:hypothetical protein
MKFFVCAFSLMGLIATIQSGSPSADRREKLMIFAYQLRLKQCFSFQQLHSAFWKLMLDSLVLKARPKFSSTSTMPWDCVKASLISDAVEMTTNSQHLNLATPIALDKAMARHHLAT